MTDRDRDFIREVDEAVRQDQYKKLWDQYGIYALAAAVVLVAGVAGYKGWNSWQERKSGEAGAKFYASVDPGRGARRGEGQGDLRPRWSRTGLRATALSRASSSLRPRQRAAITDKAVADYDALATTRASTTFCAAMPRSRPLRLGSTRRTMPRWRSGLRAWSTANSAWSFSARELLGLSAYRTNDMRDGREGVQRSARRSGHAAEFTGTRRYDACAHCGNSAGAEHHGEIARIGAKGGSNIGPSSYTGNWPPLAEREPCRGSCRGPLRLQRAARQ